MKFSKLTPLFVLVMCLFLFPAMNLAQSDVLDAFDRMDGTPGANWSGQVDGYAIVNEQLQVDEGGDIYWNAMELSVDQHVFVTLTTIDPAAEEIDLLLKSQSDTGWEDGLLEVWYKPGDEHIQVVTFTQADGWVQHGENIPAVFADGDRLAARARLDNIVEVYQNDDLLAAVDISSWPHAESGGYAGLWIIAAGETIFDDFGAGDGAAAFMSAVEPTPVPSNTPTLAATQTPTADPTATLTATAASTATQEPTLRPTSTPLTSVLLDDFNQPDGSLGADWMGQTSGYAQVENRVSVRDGGDIYWSAKSFGADQHVFVTLTAIDLEADEIDLLLKSQSNTMWGEGVIEVWYQPEHERVQVLTFTQEDGWVQHGGDIFVTFAQGDRFGARARLDGMVEVRHNGNLIATRDISAWPHAQAGGYIGLWMANAGDTMLDDFGGGDW